MAGQVKKLSFPELTGKLATEPGRMQGFIRLPPMKNIYPRLRQLQAELESSAQSPENGLSVLYAIRRQLLCHYLDFPYSQLMQYPSALRDGFYQMQQAPQQAPAFPTPSVSSQFAATERALRG
jgi:hypothetical protein